MAQKRMKTIAERLRENEEIMRELLAEGKSERAAKKLLPQRALEKYFRSQILENEGEQNDPEEDQKPPDSE